MALVGKVEDSVPRDRGFKSHRTLNELKLNITLKKKKKVDKFFNNGCYLSWLPAQLLLLLLLFPSRPPARFSSELLSSSSASLAATLLRSDVDCANPIDDRRRCCIVCDCGAVWRSFLVDADVDLMYDGTSSDVGEGVYDEDSLRESPWIGLRSGTIFLPETI